MLGRIVEIFLSISQQAEVAALKQDKIKLDAILVGVRADLSIKTAEAQRLKQTLRSKEEDYKDISKQLAAARQQLEERKKIIRPPEQVLGTLLFIFLITIFCLFSNRHCYAVQQFV